MRLERHHQTTCRKRVARRRQRRRNLRRVVGVVVEYGHTTRFADALEAALDTIERREAAREIRCLRAECESAAERGESIEYVVTSGNAEVDGAQRFTVELELETAPFSAVANRLADEPCVAQSIGRSRAISDRITDHFRPGRQSQRRRTGILAADHDRACTRDELREGPTYVRNAIVDVEMIGFDVRDHRHRWRQSQK